MFEILLSPDAWIALLTLTFLEIVLGIDNIIFISIAAGKLTDGDRKKATNIGLVLAMVLRILLLLGSSLLTALNEPLFHLDTKWIQGSISGQAIILFLGGLFLLYKSTKEIHEKIEDKSHDANQVASNQTKSLRAAIIQITVINVMILKFSFVKNIQNFKHHLQKQSIWNKTTFFKVQILYRGCGLSSILPL